MNILNDLTLKNLKLNKKRTIVTIIGIILSTALICAVAGMVSSFQATLIKEAKDSNGNRHVTVEEVSLNDLKYFTNNSHIKSAYLVENIGYANLEGSKNPNKPYLFIKGYTKEAFNDSKIKLIEGRIPNDDHEIVISESVIKNAQVPLKIGDTIKLDISDRLCDDGSKLNQNNPYFTEQDKENSEEDEYCDEILQKKYTQEYKIVGIMERPSYNIEGYSAPGYVAITYSRKVSADSIDVSLLFNDGAYYKTFIKNINESEELKDYNIDINRDLLRWEGIALSDSVMTMLTTVAGVVIGIIILTSVFVIKNSFDISIVEKTKQYGMLSSVGATSKQIKKNVLYEGFILGVIGIPLGILSGIFADFVLVQIINILGTSVFNELEFVFKVPILPILLSIILSAITIYLSVIRTAHKTSKISPISAIRNNNEIKITNKKLKTPKIISKVFGIGGDIAYKNLKRSKKKYRTTVISIVVSVSVFIALSTFISYGFKLTGQYYTDYNYNIQLSMSADANKAKEVYNEIRKLESIKSSSFQRQTLLEINAKDYYSDDGFFRYFGETKEKFKPENDATMYVNVDVVSLGDEYENFIKKVGGSLSDYENKGILLDEIMLYNPDEKKYEMINTYDISKNNSFKGTVGFEDNKKSFEIEVAKRTNERPMGLERTYNESGYLIVSDKVMDEIGFVTNSVIYIDSSDPDTLETNIKKVMTNFPEIVNYHVYNINKDAEARRSLILLVSIFLYGFIIVISLIGITNIFNTLTTNMNLRKKEFAMLKSIGMTKKEFNKMIRLESLMYGTKSLFIGIPLGLLGSYLMYKAFASGNDMNFLVPYTAIIISAVAVYALVGLIMHFSLKKTEKQNIIETIRNDNI